MPQLERNMPDPDLQSMATLSAKAVLQRNYLFRGLPETALERLAALATRRTYPKGAPIFAHPRVISSRRPDSLQLLEREPQLAIHLLKLLCERLRWTSELVEESAFLAGPARLAERLMILPSPHRR